MLTPLTQSCSLWHRSKLNKRFQYAAAKCRELVQHIFTTNVDENEDEDDTASPDKNSSPLKYQLKMLRAQFLALYDEKLAMINNATTEDSRFEERECVQRSSYESQHHAFML